MSSHVREQGLQRFSQHFVSIRETISHSLRLWAFTMFGNAHMHRLLIVFSFLLLTIVPSAAQTASVSATGAGTTRAYALGPGDKVRVTVFGETELTGEYDVGTSGNLSFPLIGEVPAVGRTPEQLSESIAAGLRRGYLREPRVASQVISYRPFYILGEVENPGTYPYAANLDVMSAVAVAGGYTYRANRRRAFIRHADETEERSYRLDEAVPIQPGDTIRIGERFF
jgi:protein involved in polysaccharide export with SLBB domain